MLPVCKSAGRVIHERCSPSKEVQGEKLQKKFLILFTFKSQNDPLIDEAKQMNLYD